MTATYSPRPDMIQVTYKVLSDKLMDPEKKAKDMALGQTTGTWTPNELSGKKEKLAKHMPASCSELMSARMSPGNPMNTT